MNKSWTTSAIGYALIVLTWLNQIVVEQGIPKDGKGWITFVMGNLGGLIGIFAKDWNVSNSPSPAAATKVSDVAQVKPNPAEAVK